MARRSGADPNESLELFLDTISNVFGGVLFVAMLVVLLLQVTPDSEAEAEAAEMSELTQQMAALEQAAAEADASDLRRRQLQQLLHWQGDLQARVRVATQALDAAAKRDAEATRERVELQSRLEQTQRELGELQAVIAAAQSERHGRVRLPKFRTTTKREVPVLIAGGRAMPLFDYDQQQRATAVNIQAVEVVEDGKAVRPKPGAGAEVTRANAADLVRQFTSRVSPQTHFIALGVWDNSFEQAVWLREAVVAAGYEFGLVPLADGGAIPLGGEGGVQ